MTEAMDKFDDDVKTTIEYRSKLLKNKNLLHWYKKSYDCLFKDIQDPDKLRVLELGSGTSPIKFYHPNVITSDILPLDFVEYHFDAMEMATCKELEGQTFDIITFSNVLHHIKQPLDLLTACETKLNKNGCIVFLEPNFSLLSSLIYKYIHYEYSNKDILRPELENIQGPLSSSNIALPYLIFFRNKNWRAAVEHKFSIEKTTFFTSISYFLSGGISYRLPVPGFVYRAIFSMDALLARIFPGLLSSFFVLRLRKKS